MIPGRLNVMFRSRPRPAVHLGIVTAINPCGFAMLPTWLGYFLGRDNAADR